MKSLLLAALMFVQQPNVVLLVTDDVDNKNLEFVETPVQDSLVEAGVKFNRFYVSPICTQTRFGLMFGRYRGSTNGKCVGIKETPHWSMPSIAKMMKGAGYSTAHFGKWHLGSNEFDEWESAPARHGFDTWRATIFGNVNSGCNFVNGTYQFWERIDDGLVTNTSTFTPDAIYGAFADWWATTDGPKFAYLCDQLSHAPFTGFEQTEITAVYRRFVELQDQYIATVLDTIDLSNTILIILGDNGSPSNVAIKEQRGKGKRTTYEGGINTSLVMVGYGVSHMDPSEALISVVDIFPTLADLIGVDTPKNLDGKSMLPILMDTQPDINGAVYSVLSVQGQSDFDRAVITDRWKLRRTEVFSIVREQFFDLENDPWEQKSIPAKNVPIALELRKMLDAFETQVRQTQIETEGIMLEAMGQ